jgi:hypothetical protein
MSNPRLTGPHAVAASFFNGHEHPLSTLARLLADHAERTGMGPGEAAEFFAKQAETLVREAQDSLERSVFGV